MLSTVVSRQRCDLRVHARQRRAEWLDAFFESVSQCAAVLEGSLLCWLRNPSFLFGLDFDRNCPAMT